MRNKKPATTPFGKWSYLWENHGFRLHLKLGWDPALLYEEQLNGESIWLFDPGDGSHEKKLDLEHLGLWEQVRPSKRLLHQ